MKAFKLKSPETLEARIAPDRFLTTILDEIAQDPQMHPQPDPNNVGAIGSQSFANNQGATSIDAGQNLNQSMLQSFQQQFEQQMQQQYFQMMGGVMGSKTGPIQG